MRGFSIAISTLTAIPLTRHRLPSQEELVQSVVFFPLVGFGIGGLLMLVAQWARPLLSPGPLAALVLLILILLTGGLHLDGLADLCDGLAAGGNPDRILAVMKDHRVGAFGVMGLAMVLILKYSLFHEIIHHGWPEAFLLMGVLSRWAMALASVFGTYARIQGTGQAIIGRVGWPQGLLTSVLALGLAWLSHGAWGVAAGVVVVGAVFVFIRFVESKITGLTGDCLGALNELTEILVLLVLVMTTPLMESR